MRVLLGRLWRTLTPDTPCRVVQIKVLTRHRIVDQRRRPVFVDRRHIESLMAEAIPQVRQSCFRLDGVYAYDENVEARLVLVDYIANQVRSTLRHATRSMSLAEMEAELQAATSMPVRARCRTLLAFSGGSAVPQTMPNNRWVTEAQTEWAEA
jgi:hypothetical protein